MKILYLIPARGGSKGIPGKNTKKLAGKPLIHYTIDLARQLAGDENICVTTDDSGIIEKVEQYGLKVPFIRKPELASDQSGMHEVIVDAIEFYETKNIFFDLVVLLQPTSPFRTADQIKEAISLYSSEIDMVVSVVESESNPYYNLFEEGIDGFLEHSKSGSFIRRQDCPKIYKYNGAIYVIKVNSLKKNKISEFSKVKKYIMDEIHSVDLDNNIDWEFAEFLILNRKI